MSLKARQLDASDPARVVSTLSNPTFVRGEDTHLVRDASGNLVLSIGGVRYHKDINERLGRGSYGEVFAWNAQDGSDKKICVKEVTIENTNFKFPELGKVIVKSADVSNTILINESKISASKLKDLCLVDIKLVPTVTYNDHTYGFQIKIPAYDKRVKPKDVIHLNTNTRETDGIETIRFYFVMDIVDVVPVAERKKLSNENGSKMLKRLKETIIYIAETFGVVYIDVNFGNILFTKNGKEEIDPVIIDYGSFQEYDAIAISTFGSPETVHDQFYKPTDYQNTGAFVAMSVNYVISKYTNPVATENTMEELENMKSDVSYTRHANYMERLYPDGPPYPLDAFIHSMQKYTNVMITEQWSEESMHDPNPNVDEWFQSGTI